MGHNPKSGEVAAVPRLEIGTRTALSGGLAKRRERARMAITRRRAITVQQPNLSEKIDRLSVVGRQCVAVICLERFCRKYRLTHPAITKFIDHVWKVTQVDPETFGEWEEGFSLMPITGRGDPYPKDLVEAIPKELLNEFDRLTQFVFETSATTWYCSDIEGTKNYLLKVLDIASNHNIPIPDLGFYMNAPIEHHGCWGTTVTDEQLQHWRNTA